MNYDEFYKYVDKVNLIIHIDILLGNNISICIGKI